MSTEHTPEEPTSEPRKSETEQVEQPKSQPGVETVHIKHAHKLVYGYLALLVVAALVGFGGYWYHKHHSKPVPTHSASARLQTTKVDPYAGWKVFTDNASASASGISIKYPSGWRVNTTSSKTYAWSITKSDNTRNVITVRYVFQNSDKTAQQEWEACEGTDSCGGSSDDTTLSGSPSTINSLNAYTATIKNSLGTYHVAIIKGNKPTFQGTPYVEFMTYASDQVALNTFSKIVDSATFPNPYSGWKTFKSDDGVFTLSYPSTWTSGAPGDCGLLTCVAQYGFGPSNLNNVLIDVIEVHSSLTPQEWFQKNFAPSSGDDTDVSRAPINNYDTYHDKIADYPTGYTNPNYIEEHYTISHNGYIVDIRFREISNSFLPNSETLASHEDFSQYIPEFDSVVNSIAFKN